MNEPKKLRSWGVFFDNEVPYSQAKDIRKKVAEFFLASDESKISIEDEKISFYGKVYGHEDYEDGEKIVVSEINTIEVMGDDSTRRMFCLSIDGVCRYLISIASINDTQNLLFKSYLNL